MIPPVVTLPATAYRRTWFADRLKDAAGRGVFGRLLAQVAPRVYAQLRDRHPFACYWALIAYVDACLFPLAPWIIDDIEFDPDEGSEDDVLAALVDRGIVPGTEGVDPDDDGVDSPALALCLRLTTDAHALEVLDDFDLADLWLTARPLSPRHRVRPPRGRVWRKPWQGLNDLFAWATSSSGNAFVDLSLTQVQESYSLDAWTLENVRVITRTWQRAKAILRRAAALRAFVDQAPAERLPLLAGALLGRRSALAAVTVARPRRRR